MQQFLNSWASGLIVAVIIVTIIELLLPENKNKKYIKVVGGLFILFTIVSPIALKFGSGINFDIQKYATELSTNNTEANIEATKETASVVTDKNVMKIYKENLKRNIKAGIENLNYVIKNIEIEVDEDKNYGDIKNIYLSAENVENVPQIYVENVSVNVSNTISNVNKDGDVKANGQNGVKNNLNLLENDKNIIREFLNKNYRISSKNIHINE